MSDPGAIAMYAASGDDANLYYATRFGAPDPFVFVQAGGVRTIAVSDLEFGRARENATVDEVLRAVEIEEELKKSGVEKPGPADLLAHLLKRRGARSVTVPANFWTQIADELRARGVEVRAKAGAFFERRAIKTPDEVRHLEASLRITEGALDTAARILRESKIAGDRLLFEGEPLTSEILRGRINAFIASRDAVAGPTIVVDIFPRSLATMYWGDMTRTFVKGRASAEVKKLYKAVERGQQIGFDRVKAGADGKAVHQEICQYFERDGYKTEPRGGKMVGFFHGTGHGLGLDIHEAPSIGKRGTPLEEGAVVTVEPGLYYFGLGGVRIEDVVLVESGGCRLLSRYPRVLEID
ncbi:MAG TPA: Xaa-Pro peptidase family protein [Planctomycetota bacterium]|nr:Xaa-Pro peptidase family protein [Planctomycetota bacterium]